MPEKKDKETSAHRRSGNGGVKYRLMRLAAILLSFLAAFIMIEIFSSIYAYAKFGTLSTSKLYKLERENTFLSNIFRRNQTYLETLYPHPYLAHVHRPSRGFNNVGLFGPDFPMLRDNDKFVILFTGGSVASQFVEPHDDGSKYLEDILNRRYDFNGREVLILNGADGAWKQPQQLIIMSLYSDVIDAVVTLDGFNEHFSIKNPDYRLEYPSMRYISINPLVSGSAEELASAWISNRIYV